MILTIALSPPWATKEVETKEETRKKRKSGVCFWVCKSVLLLLLLCVCVCVCVFYYVHNMTTLVSCFPTQPPTQSVKKIIKTSQRFVIKSIISYIKVFCFLCTFFHTFFFEFLIHFCVAACLHEWNVLYYISVLPSKVLICIIFYNFFLLTVTAFRASGTFN